MKKENSLYIRYDHNEATMTKKHMLYTEISLLKILQTIRTYDKLRKIEFKLKENFKKNLKEIGNNIEKIEVTFPEIKKPEILKTPKEKEEEMKKKEKKPQKKEEKPSKKEKYSDKIENELKEIQERLSKIE